MSDYLALLPLTASLDADGVRHLALRACLDLYRVEWLRAYVDVGGSRMLCWYRAPDAESVRFVLRQQDAHGARVVPVTVSEASVAEPLDAPRDGIVVELPGAVAAALGDAFQRVDATAIRTFTARREYQLFACVAGVDRTDVEVMLAGAGIEARAVWRCRELDPRPSPLFAGADVGTVSGNTVRGQARSHDAGDRQGSGVLDAVIIGAGLSGIAMLERLVRRGRRVQVFEAGSDVGGVWHWNRYPGARIDSESYTYVYAFSDALREEWRWRELFPPQAEIADYFRHVVDRFDLRRHIRFETRVTAARFDEAARLWHVESDRGERVAARHLIAAADTLSTPQLPDYPGLDTFAGASHHTARWPAEGLDLAGKRVGVIGTGATGVQVIQTIAAEVGHLTVFQRTPTYCIPQRNRSLTAGDHRAIQRDWDEILAACRESVGGFIHTFDPRPGLTVAAAEREAKFEALWAQPGFAFWFGNFGDLMMNDEVNAHACDFVRRKIAARVRDPEVARKLMPDHPFGAKRVPLENGYYEAFNRPNVRLVDLREAPIERITRAGVRTAREEVPLDVIVYATGFDAGTGALTRIDVRGPSGVGLAEKWRAGPRTYLGLLVHGFPNFFMVNGPQNAAALCNAGRCVEPNVDWIARCLDVLDARGCTRVEPTAAAEDAWTRHVDDVAAATVLARMANSWFYGANTPGKARRVNVYAAGARVYREQCEGVARAGFPGLAFE